MQQKTNRNIAHEKTKDVKQQTQGIIKKINDQI